MTASRRVRRIAQGLLALGFALALAAQTYCTAANLVADRAAMPRALVRGEDRATAYLRIKDFPGEFERFFEHRVGGSADLVRRFGEFKVHTLGVSPTPRVWFGDGGWMFFNHEADPTYLAATDPRLPARLAQWERALPEWREWLAERGIRFLVVVPANKQSIYPELLPGFVRNSLPAITPTDRLIAAWRGIDPLLDVLDLRAPLRREQGGPALYYKEDSHWNIRGIHLGYHETVRRLGRDHRPEVAFFVNGEVSQQGDLGGRLLGFPDGGHESTANVSVRAPTARLAPVEIADDGSRLDYLNQRAWERPTRGDGNCVVFHDSFGDLYYTAFLAEHFDRLVAVPANHLDPSVIERERPAVVIFEMVERIYQAIDARRPSDAPRRSLTR